MKRRFFTLLAAVWPLLAALALAGPARADLKGYLTRPEPSFTWEKKGQTKASGGTIHLFHLVSQVWQGITWEHSLQLFVPDNVSNPRVCTLLNTGGNPGGENEALGMAAAKMSGSPFAVLYNIPKQPLYNGLYEDALIVYTWQQFMKTGDESWPLHFPMAKAVLKAMDVLQAYTSKNGPKIEKFIVTGASKRGWTTWLVGASQDKRLLGIAPMVIDVLNVAAQMKHQFEMYGQPSEEVGDYTAAGMEKVLGTPQGQRLMELEDPYSYREILTLPKLLLLGTNDRYWTQDALNLYWDGLKGPKWVLYAPNSGHGLEDRGRVVATLTAFTRMLASGKPWPKMQWGYQDTAAGADLWLKSDQKPAAARLFFCLSPTLDFRDSKWRSIEISPDDDGAVTASFRRVAGRNAAIYGEATYEIGGKSFTLSTQIKILKAK